MVMEPKDYAEEVIEHPDHYLRIFDWMPREWAMKTNTCCLGMYRDEILPCYAGIIS